MGNEQGTPLVPASRDALISIIDDDQSVREALQDLIDSLGFRVHAFPSAIEFLASPDIRTTSCMIADVHMPHMSGVELYRRVTELGHAIPTILITAYPNDSVRDRALAAGVICYLTKPFDDNALIGCVQSALQNAKPGADA
jgi:FixJ family two-component response regulator